MCLWPFGSGRTTNAALRWGLLCLQRHDVAGWKSGWHLTRRCPDSATQPPCADYSCSLVMRKSCKMYTGWASSWCSCPYHYACSIPCATCDVTGTVGTVRWASLECADLSFCSCPIALADSRGAGSCSQLAEPASSPSLRCSPAPQEVLVMAAPGVALLSEASVSPVGS